MQYRPSMRWWTQGLSCCGRHQPPLILHHPTIFTSPSVATEELKVLQKCFAILYFCAFAQGNTTASRKCLFWELHYSIRVLMLPNRSSCPQRGQTNYISLEERKVYWRTKQGEQVTHDQNPWAPRWLLGRSVYRQNLGWVTFFWLAAGEVTRWCSRKFVFSLRLLSSSGWGALVPPEELKYIVMYVLQKEPGCCSIPVL